MTFHTIATITEQCCHLSTVYLKRNPVEERMVPAAGTVLLYPHELESKPVACEMSGSHGAISQKAAIFTLATCSINLRSSLNWYTLQVL
jgi:hypothetical protein